MRGEEIVTHLKLPAEPEAAYKARAMVTDLARNLGCMTEPDLDDLEVAVGETFANIVLHGACHAHDPVDISIVRHPDRVVVHFHYASAPFNTAPDIPAPEDMAGGGYGLFIVRALMDEVEIEFTPGRAHVCFAKKCDAPVQ